MTALPSAPPFPQLARVAGAGRLPPSLLFTGPPGALTKEAALGLAAVANSADPDPESAASRRVMERIVWTDAAAQDPADAGTPPAGGPWPDIHVVHPDPKGEVRVDALRDAIQASRPHPFEGSRRFLVIVGADGMNPSAANALLKTLEEPHPQLGVILTAVRESALLPTIVSRCQRWRFRGPREDEVAERLRREHDYPEEEAAWAAAGGGDLQGALALPRERLSGLVKEALGLARVASRGIVPGARARLVERLSGGRGRPGGGGAAGGGDLQVLLTLLRAALRDLAALAAGAAPLSGDPGGLLAPLAREAPATAFAEAFALVEETDRAIHQGHGNRRMQLDALLLDFNEIARPLVVARMRAARKAKASAKDR